MGHVGIGKSGVMDGVFLQMINRKMFESGQITEQTRERIDSDIRMRYFTNSGEGKGR